MPDISQTLRIRDIVEGDKDLLLEWANDPAVRENAFNRQKIDAAEHEVWFHRSIADKENCLMLLFTMDEGRNVGQVRFNRRIDGAWYIDYSVAPSMRGRGLGSRILEAAVHRLAEKVGSVTIRGWVKLENDRSRRVFEGLGFRIVDSSPSGDALFELDFADAQKPLICIATPHRRNDGLVGSLSVEFPELCFRRIVSNEELKAIKTWRRRPEWIFFPHWSWIISEEIYENFRCVIFHMTDLPYGRGGSPLQNLIVRGHKDTQVSAIKCAKELDSGDVYSKEYLSLHGSAEDILKRASDIIHDLIRNILKNLPAPIPQEGEVTYFTRRGRADGDITGLDQLESVYDYIRMLDAEGYPRAFASFGRFRLEFEDARLDEDFVEAKVKIRIRDDAK